MAFTLPRLLYSDFPIKRSRMITTMGLVTHAMKSQKRTLRSSHRAIAITRIHSSTFMVVVIFRYFVGLVDLMGQRYGIYLTLPNVSAKKDEKWISRIYRISNRLRNKITIRLQNPLHNLSVAIDKK